MFSRLQFSSSGQEFLIWQLQLSLISSGGFNGLPIWAFFFFLWREIMDFTLLMQLELILTVWRIEPRCVRVLVCTFGFVKTFFLRWYFRKTLVDWFRDISQNRGWVVGLPVYIQRYISLFSEWKGRCFPLFTGVQPKAGTGLKMQTVSVVFSTLHC